MPFSRSRALLLAVGAVLLVPLLSAAPAQARLAPPAARDLPADIESYAQYMGQTLCSPTAKPGSAKLAALLRATYGNYSIGISRDCSYGGVSEHKEGRALDWMVSKRVKAQKKAAKSFLAWLLAPDAQGRSAAMARRLGVMYIGWNDQMWRAYDPNRGKDGWDDLKGCSTTPSMQAQSYDTYCHRNHVHLSLSWDGAEGLTSFWTGKAMTTPDCARPSYSTSMPGVGSGSDPVVIFDSTKGKGTTGSSSCRVAAPRWSGDDRTQSITVPMPEPVDGVSYKLRVRVDKYDANAPTQLVLDTSKTTPVTVSATAPLPKEKLLPIGNNGKLTVAVGAGQAAVKLTGLGLVKSGTEDPPAAPPTGSPRVSLHTPATVVKSTTIAFSGKVENVPSNAKVQRYLKVGKGQWSKRGDPVSVAGGRWSTSTAAPSTAQKLKYKAGVLVNGKVVDRSKKKTVLVVAQPKTSLHVPDQVATGGKLVLSGKVKDAPAGTTVQRFLKVDSGWESRGSQATPATSGAWKLTTTAPSTPGKLKYRIAMWSDGEIIAWSNQKKVTIG